MSGPSRRDFLKTGALSTLFLGSGALAACGAGQVRTEGQARNVIFLVSDGMSAGTLTMADVMRRRRDGYASNWIRYYEEGRVRRGLMDMASADAIVTDSSAAASSWGCGHRINNGSVNIGVNGEHHPALLPIFSEAGRATGLVTTTEITHATPAGFAANVESRNFGQEIASQYLERSIDLLLGGAHNHYAADRRNDGRDLYEEHRNAGYRVVRTRNDLLANGAGTEPLLGIFANGHLPYSLDHQSTPELMESVPTLPEMTALALEKLSRHPNGFILQVEGGRVDHGAHNNDLGALMFDQLTFDEAIGVAVDFAEGRDDTLVVITSDHGNANPGFNQSADSNFDRIQEFRYTNSWIQSGLNQQSTVAQIQERIEAATNIEVREAEAEILQQSIRGNFVAAYRAMSGRNSVLGQIIANHTHVNWIGGNHTADYVEIASLGPGSEALEGFVRNTHVFDVVTRAAGVSEYVSA